MLAAQQKFDTLDPRPYYVSADPSFVGVFPDMIYRPKFSPAQQMVWASTQPTSHAPTVFSWNVMFPDWIAPKGGLKPYLAQTFDMNQEPIPDPPVVENSWSPNFPDFAKKAYIQVANQPSLYWSSFTPDRVPWEWQNQRPDFARRARRNPFGLHVRGAVPASLPSDFIGTFPDLIDIIHMRERPSIFEPQVSVFPANAALHAWDPEYPAWVRAHKGAGLAALVASMTQSLVIPQVITGGDVDLILINDQDGTFSTHFSESVWGSSLQNESLTTSG